MQTLYSYVLRFDDGAAPNPFWNICSLAICKPKIRKQAKVGDWVVGTGSANSKISPNRTRDFAGKLVYAMKVSKTMSFQRYDSFCKEELTNKIPSWYSRDWRMRLGDCIYEYLGGKLPRVRKGVHTERNRKKDLSGTRVLLSNNFYYFGSEPVVIPDNLRTIVQPGQGHKKTDNTVILMRLEEWLSQFEANKIYSEPQASYLFKINREKTKELESEYLNADNED